MRGPSRVHLAKLLAKLDSRNYQGHKDLVLCDPTSSFLDSNTSSPVSIDPAPPSAEDRPIIWRPAVVQLLLRHPDICLRILPQWWWGAGAVKPTGLITVRMPTFKQDMYNNQVPFAIKPTAPIIGRLQDGSFKTSEHQEYPDAFCKALASSFLHRLQRQYRNGLCAERTAELPTEVTQWLLEARDTSSEIRAEARWLPDFQG